MSAKTNFSDIKTGFDLLVIGAGASGIAAAVAAARRGCRVCILERLDSCARKVSASGGGKCNLLNRLCHEKFYNQAGQALVRSVFRQRPQAEVLEFFSGLGLEVYSDGDRYFPRSNQAATVVRVLELELQRLGVPVEYGCQVCAVKRCGNGFTVTSTAARHFSAGRLVLAAGGASYPALGSNGSGFELARSLGHRVVAPVPAAVPLVVKDPLCHRLQGQKIPAYVRAVRGDTVIAESGGDLLFTAYGLSGTAVLDVSREISVLLNRRPAKDIVLVVDCVPWISQEELTAVLRRKMEAGYQPCDLLAGILSNKLARAVIPPARPAAAESLAAELKAKRFAVSATRGWNEAEFTAGGVDTSEVDEKTLESKRCPGVYLCGEVLDVDGRRGGHNLAWAWASGLAAGDNACETGKLRIK